MINHSEAKGFKPVEVELGGRVEGAGKLRNSEESQCGGWYEKIAVTRSMKSTLSILFRRTEGLFFNCQHKYLGQLGYIDIA